MENTKQRTVEAEFLLNITDVIGDRHLVTLSATASLLPAITFLSLSGPLDYSSGGSPKRTAQKPNHYRVHQWTAEWLFEMDIEETHHNYHFAEPIGKDEWLLVCARAADDSEHNVFVYDNSGKYTRSFPVGDGIEDVQVSQDGEEIWLSYFDEGVFSGGNLGAEGLRSFKPDGAPAFRYYTDVVDKAPHNAPQIADCYAMNVSEDGGTWLYYYTDFPLVRLHNGQVKTVWRGIPVSGSHAFAVTNDRVLFGGGYNEKDRLHLVSLYPNASKSETIILVNADGNPITSPRVLFVRGSRLYILRNDDNFVLDLQYHL